MKNLFSGNLCSPGQIEGTDIYDLVAGVLSLNDLETSILFSLFDTQYSAVELSKSSKKHRSTIQKALSNLMSKGLIIRKKKSLRRGYHFTYTAISKDKIREIMIRHIDEQTDCLKRRIIDEI